MNSLKLCVHQRVDELDNECFLLTWSISKKLWTDGMDVVQTMKFEVDDNSSYCATLGGFQQDFDFSITSDSCNMMCSVSIFTCSGRLLFSNTLKEPTRNDCSSYHYDLISLTCDDQHFLQLKQQRNENLILICRIISRSEKFYLQSVETADEYMDSVHYMKKLAEAIKYSSEYWLKDNVTLRIGNETETVNKAVLCARSPFFTNMFRSNREEVKENVVTISDFTMPILRILISFLYTGKLPHSNSDMTSSDYLDLDSLCDIYRAADKYCIVELRQICVDLLLPRISRENIFQVSKLAFSHPDERLKSSVKAFISAHIDTLVDKNEWKDFFNDVPQFVVEALTFFDI